MFKTVLNVHMDTPTEILHTILLGVVKYFWGQMVFLLKKSKLLYLFQNHLKTVNKDALNALCLNADYICHLSRSALVTSVVFSALSVLISQIVY